MLYCLSVAEGEGFGPQIPFRVQVVFKTTAIDHSAIAPQRAKSLKPLAPHNLRRNARLVPRGLILTDCHQPW